MSLLLESIKYENGQWFNLSAHEQRMRQSIKDLYKLDRSFELQKRISIPAGITLATYKCRILYNKDIQRIDFIPYIKKDIQKVVLITDDKINYPYKYADRSQFDKYTQFQEPTTEIIIVKNKIVRDSSYANLAFFNGHEWHTPSVPLLKGTKRGQLLAQKKIIPKRITLANLHYYYKVSFINALNELNELTLDLNH